MAQTIKRPPAMQETRVRSLGSEDPLEEEMATHSSILTWRIPWTEDPDRLQSMGSQRVGHNWATSLSFFLWVYLTMVIVIIALSLCCNQEGIFLWFSPGESSGIPRGKSHKTLVLSKDWGPPPRVHAAMKFKTKNNKNCLLLARKTLTNLDSILKSRDTTLPKRSI